MSIIFFGTPNFAINFLEELFKAKENIALVVTRPDKPRKRGENLLPSPIKEKAKQLNLPFLEMEKFTPEIKEKLKKLKPEFFIVVAFGKIFPEDVLQIPKNDCINLHASLLPKYRGAAPIQWALINGERETGITSIKMNKEMDAGDILLQEKISLKPNDTYGTLSKKLQDIGAKVLLETIKLHRKNIIIPQKQLPEGITFAPSLKKEIRKINWKLSPKKITNLIRALNPKPGAYTIYKNKIIKIWQAETIFINITKKYISGQVIFYDKKNGLVIKTGEGFISLKELQLAGKNKLNINDFLNGFKITVGDIFN